MNNYDRMHRGEEQKPPLPVNKAKVAVNRKRRKAGKLVYSGLIVVCVFVLLILFDVFGTKPADAIYGAIGVSSIALAIIGIIVCAISIIGLTKRKLSASKTAYCIILCVLLVIFLQVITTVSTYNSLENPSYSAYLNASFANGRNNAGGFIFSTISYPFLRWFGAITSLCIIAVLFFGVLLLCFRSFFYVYRARRVLTPEDEAPETPTLYVESLDESAKKAKSEEKKLADLDISFPNDVSPDEEDDEAEINYAESGLSPTNAVIKKMLDSETDKTNRKRLASDVLFMPDDKLKKVIGTDKKEEEETDSPVNTGKRSSIQPQFGDGVSASAPKTEDETSGGILDDYKKGKLGFGAADILFGDVVQPRPPKPSTDAPRTEIKPVPEQPKPAPIYEDHVVTPEAASGRNPIINPVVEPLPKTESTAPSYDYDSKTENEQENPGVYDDYDDTDTDIDINQANQIEQTPTNQDNNAQNPVQSNSGGYSGGFVRREFPKEEPPTAQTPPPLKSPSAPVTEPKFKPAEKKKMRPYCFPSIDILRDYMPPTDYTDYESIYKHIEAAFASFDVRVRVLGHTKGASYTQYAVKLADGVYFRKVVSLEEDIKRKLCLKDPINIVSSVKDLDAVGLEISNPTRTKVGLKQFINHSNFKKDNRLYFLIGINVYGEPYFCNIIEAPHLLIAGTTGSGKSICINSIICSIIYNYSPDYVKFVLVDPKSVELANFAEIPHNLLGRSVVSAPDCIKALDAVIEEMERRYEILKTGQCKKLETYNDYLKSIGKQPLPYIVVIIDELSDLMLSNKKTAPELEKRISRLTAKSRASGIHLIIATQRPSIDVVTGVIKNNIPTRIAFTMGDAVGSKVVIDRGGAEKLYGKGDLLYYSPDYGSLIRLQAPFMDEQEVIDITDYVKDNNDADFDEELCYKIFSEGSVNMEERIENDYRSQDGSAGTRDTLFEQAVRFAVSQGVISINKLQRQFRLGFTRAGYLIDEMEKRGIVDAPVAGTSRPRTVLITEDQLESVLSNESND